MHADGIVLATDRASMLEEHLAAWRNKRPRMFWIGLALAFVVHALFIVGIGSARQRELGTPDGANDAIAVEIVDGATLKDSMELPTPSTTPPGNQQKTAAQQPAEAPTPQPPAEPPVEPQQPQPPAEAAQPPPSPPETKAPPTEAPKVTAEALPAFEDAPEGETTPPEAAPEPAKPKAEAKKPVEKKQQAKQPPKKRTQTSALDLSVPYEGGSSADDDDGGSSAVQRPPGITRSGENDAFALDVIRALKRSMPRGDAMGRVTVKIVLNENGSRADVKLVQSGGNPDLDFNVMLSARQTAYPFPPKNSTLVDRTFTVTYIYR